MKLKDRIFIILINLLIITLFVSNISLATYNPGLFNPDIDSVKSNEIVNIGGKVVGIIQIIGTIISVGMLTIIGIKYSIGSAEQKASYKKTLLPYLIGSILIFGATNLTQMVYDFTTNSTKTEIKTTLLVYRNGKFTCNECGHVLTDKELEEYMDFVNDFCSSCGAQFILEKK